MKPKMKMTGAEHAAFRRLLWKYSNEQTVLSEECERCAVPRNSERAIRFTTPHKEEAYANIKDRGFDTSFEPNVVAAKFCDDTEEALIEEVYELGDTAWLCNACAKFWIKAHAQVEPNEETP